MAPATPPNSPASTTTKPATTPNSLNSAPARRPTAPNSLTPKPSSPPSPPPPPPATNPPHTPSLGAPHGDCAPQGALANGSCGDFQLTFASLKESPIPINSWSSRPTRQLESRLPVLWSHLGLPVWRFRSIRPNRDLT